MTATPETFKAGYWMTHRHGDRPKAGPSKTHIRNGPGEALCGWTTKLFAFYPVPGTFADVLECPECATAVSRAYMTGALAMLQLAEQLTEDSVSIDDVFPDGFATTRGAGA